MLASLSPKSWRSCSIVCAAMVSFASNAPSFAQGSVESFYKGKSIIISLGFPPGGSYDTYARLAAAYMGKYIPGNPSFIIQNKASGGIGVLRSFY